LSDKRRQLRLHIFFTDNGRLGSCPCVLGRRSLQLDDAALLGARSEFTESAAGPRSTVRLFAFAFGRFGRFGLCALGLEAPAPVPRGAVIATFGWCRRCGTTDTRFFQFAPLGKVFLGFLVVVPIGVKEGIGESANNTAYAIGGKRSNGIDRERQSKGARGDEGEGFEHHHLSCVWGSRSRSGNPPINKQAASLPMPVGTIGRW